MRSSCSRRKNRHNQSAISAPRSTRYAWTDPSNKSITRRWILLLITSRSRISRSIKRNVFLHFAKRHLAVLPYEDRALFARLEHFFSSFRPRGPHDCLLLFRATGGASRKRRRHGSSEQCHN